MANRQRTFDISTLHYDLLVHLLKFMDPEDQFNLVLSGVLEGFHNSRISVYHDIKRCYKSIFIILKSSRDCPDGIEIGSLVCSNFEQRNLTVLKRMVRTSLFAHVGQLELIFDESSRKSMMTIEDLVNAFECSPNLKTLSIRVNLLLATAIQRQTEFEKESLQVLQLGFGRIERLELTNCLTSLFRNSWPMFQEILLWCAECSELLLCEYSYMHSTEVSSDTTRADLSLIPSNPDFGRQLQTLHYSVDSDDVLEWFSDSVYRNVRTLNINTDGLPFFISGYTGFLNLRKVIVDVTDLDEIEEILHNCLELEVLHVHCLRRSKTKELKSWAIAPPENLLDLELSWVMEPYITEVLPVFRSWRHLRRLALSLDRSDYDKVMGRPEPRLIAQFILGMRHLTYLCIYDSIFSERERTIFKTEVDDLVQRRRPDFIFEVSQSDDFWSSYSLGPTPN